MSNDAVFHRRNKQIQDAIDGQNLKQALQLCEKRIKKGEDTRFLRAWKAYILFSHTDEAHHQRGIQETLQICQLEPPTTDLDTLDILYQTLRKLEGEESKMQELWENAAKTKPQDLQVQLRWFTYAFEGGNWKSAQKAAMSLQNNFSKTRKYYFWAIFLCYLITVDPSASDADRKFFGTLAYRMISKSADNVPADPKELLSPPRAIQSAEELFLLIKIFESQGRHVEIVKILDSANLGLNSRIVQHEWFFYGAKLANIEKAGLWNQGLEFAHQLLAMPEDEAMARKLLQERDDWGVWQLLLSATQNIKDPCPVRSTQKFIEDFIKRFPKSRNAQLALLDLTSWRVNNKELSLQDLFAACQTYYDQNCAKVYCFDDLRKYISNLETEHRRLLIEHVSRNAKESKPESNPSEPFQGVRQVNALKLEYCFRLFYEDTASTQEMSEFIMRCLEAYRDIKRPDQPASGSNIETQPSDDLCLLAAMSLIKGSDYKSRYKHYKSPSSTLVGAAAIIEYLLQKSPHNYHALLLLVRIYLFLGAGSLALKTFSKLSVKQMQFETVSHNLFTRLSTIHPQSAPPVEGVEYKDFDPQSALIQALSFYRHADTTTTRSRTSGLDHGSYVNIEGALDLQKRLNQSICRRMWALDVRRMQRLVGGGPTGRYDIIAMDESPLFDQRTFSAFLNCEPPEKPTFEEQMRLGPLPKERWVKNFQVTDRLFTHLKALSLQKPSLPDSTSLSLEELNLSDVDQDMTTTETDNVKIHSRLLKAVLYMSGDNSISATKFEESVLQVEDWLASIKERLTSGGRDTLYLTNTTISLSSTKLLQCPSWLFFHDSFLLLETLKAIDQLVAISSKQAKSAAKLPKDRVVRLKALTQEIHESVKANTRCLKAQLSEPGVLGTLIDIVLNSGGGNDGSAETPLRKYLEDALDAGALEVFCGNLMESWEEGLEGIFSVALK